MNKKTQELIEKSIKILLQYTGIAGLILALSFKIPANFCIALLMILTLTLILQFVHISKKLSDLINTETDEYSVNLIEYSTDINKKKSIKVENKKIDKDVKKV